MTSGPTLVTCTNRVPTPFKVNLTQLPTADGSETASLSTQAKLMIFLANRTSMEHKRQTAPPISKQPLIPPKHNQPWPPSPPPPDARRVHHHLTAMPIPNGKSSAQLDKTMAASMSTTPGPRKQYFQSTRPVLAMSTDSNPEPVHCQKLPHISPNMSCRR